MDPKSILEAVQALTLSGALALAVVAFALDFIRSARSEDKRFKAYADERDERDKLLIAERDEWKQIAHEEQRKREEADERLERIVDAFETATNLVLRSGDGK